MPRNCSNNPDSFCYVCGELTFTSQRLNFTPLIEQCYLDYFGCPVEHQDKSWVPHKCCVTCVKLLLGWAKQEPRHLPFDIPMIWTEPKDDVSDCYFSLTQTKGVTTKSKHIIQYPKLSSANRLILHSAELPVSKPPNRPDSRDSSPELVVSSHKKYEDSDPSYEAQTSKEPHLLTQKNDHEKLAWRCFVSVVQNFRGKHKAENYKDLINELIVSYKALGYNMRLKIHMLDSHLDFIPANLCAVSDEQGERFHQYISLMEKRYQGKWSPGMLPDYCWRLRSYQAEAKYSHTKS